MAGKGKETGIVTKGKDQRLVVRVDLSGPDGNVFPLVGIVRDRLAKAQRAQDSADVLKRFMQMTGQRCTYDDVLNMLGEYVKLVDTSELRRKK